MRDANMRTRTRFATEQELDTLLIDQMHLVPAESGAMGAFRLESFRTMTMREVMAESPSYQPLVEENYEPSIASLLNMPGAE